jgi:predicted metal-dependent peptidase
MKLVRGMMGVSEMAKGKKAAQQPQTEIKVLTDAEKADLEAQAQRMMSRTRVKLIMGRKPDEVFFASLGMRLQCFPTWRLPTAATDGHALYYNPYFWVNLTDKTRMGVFIHEVMHCVMQHMARRKHRHPKRWNAGGDLAINDIIREGGFELPEGALFPEQYDLPPRLSADEYYNKLPDDAFRCNGKHTKADGTGEPCDGSCECEDGDLDSGGCGSVLDSAKDEVSCDASAREWAQATAQAAQASKLRGKLPGSLQDWVDGLFETKVDWRHVLREWVTQKVKTDYCWAKPNKNYISAGIYLPTLYSEAMGHIVVHFDTSGSISNEELAEYVTEIQGIFEMTPARLTLIGSDYQVVPEMVTEWEPSDGPIRRYKAHGRGGTSHVPVFDYVRDALQDNIVGLISFTDLATAFPSYEPEYPVLWIAKKSNANSPVPFGEVVEF